MLIIAFIIPMFLIPQDNNNMQNAKQEMAPEPLETNVDYFDYTITESGTYTGDSFGGYLTIVSLGEGITVNFTNCIFNGNRLRFGIQNDPNSANVDVEFQGCSITYDSILFIYNAKAIFRSSTIETCEFGCGNRLDQYGIDLNTITFEINIIEESILTVHKVDNLLHQFVFDGYSKVLIDNSKVYGTVSFLEAFYYVEFTIRNNSELILPTNFRDFECAKVTIDQSTFITDDILLFPSIRGLPLDNATLIINNSNVRGPIYDLTENAEVIIQNSQINFTTSTVFVTGSNLFTIQNDVISGDPADYSIISYIEDPNSYYIVFGLNKANIIIDSSHIAIAVISGESTMSISNSTIFDFIDANDKAILQVSDSTLLGDGLAKNGRAWNRGDAHYGCIGAPMGAILSQGGEQSPLISLISCTILGKVSRYGTKTFVFQECIYSTPTLEIYYGTQGQFLVVEMNSVSDIILRGWNVYWEPLIDATLRVNGKNATQISSLHFTLDPSTPGVPGSNVLFEINALFPSVEGDFSCNFSIEVVIVFPPSETLPELLGKLNTTIMLLDNNAFDRNPAQRKNALGNKIQLISKLVDFDCSIAYIISYYILLIDIKPKLTGLKTDENEIPWGNGVFKNPWVISSTAQESLLIQCNQILAELNLLM